MEADADRLFTALGRVAFTSASLEGQFAFTCWKAAGVDTEVGRVLTAGMSSLVVIDRVEILVGMRYPKLAATTKEVCRSARLLLERRNRVIHGAWGWDPGNLGAAMAVDWTSRAAAKGMRLDHAGDLQAIEELSSELSRCSDRILREILPALSTS